VQRDPGDSTLLGLVGAVLAVADDRVAGRRKLHPDLILQACEQRDSDQRSSPQRTFDRIMEFCSRRFRIFLRAQLLVHAFFSKVVDQCSLFLGEMAANNSQILPDRCMRKKLPHQLLSISRGLRKQQNSGCETIDTMDDQSPLPATLQFRGEN